MPVLGKRPKDSTDNNDVDGDDELTFGPGKLHRAEVERYSRQIMLPEVTSIGARALLDASVLVVGAGGLGSSVVMYLAAAGVGHIGIVDFDAVDRSNLHRQVVHPDARVGVNKAVSAAATCEAINPTIRMEPIQEQFTAANGQALVDRFDVIIDATDNVAARYLINDACALAAGGRRPLVSGSAMRWEGQITVYNYGDNGPCFRCVFPTPPPAASVGSCSDSGVIGAVPGTIGCMQALEAQKILMPAAAAEGGVLSGRMLFWDGLRGTFRMMKLRPRSATCAVCGTDTEVPNRITTIASVGAVYEAGNCARPPPSALPKVHRLASKEAIAMVRGMLLRQQQMAAEQVAAPAPIVVDVRVPIQFDMCALPGAINVPLGTLDAASKAAAAAENGTGALTLLEDKIAPLLAHEGSAPQDVFILCRRGIASLAATTLLFEEATRANAITEDGRVVLRHLPGEPAVRLLNVDGGLTAMTANGLEGFPAY